MDIRLLKASEIECRVQSVKKTSKGVGCILLLYKDARVDMKLLDEIYGSNNWQRTHEVINGNLFCNIDIWDADKACWVRKQDVGTESNTEKEKGQASDSFKRAGFNLGIGRELYTAPFIWINLNEGEHYQKGDKYYLSPSIKFSIKSIGYNENREINKLEIIDNHNKVRYVLGKQIASESINMPVDLKSSVKANKQDFKCTKCGKQITEKVANYSKSKFGQSLCMDCQKK